MQKSCFRSFVLFLRNPYQLLSLKKKKLNNVSVTYVNEHNATWNKIGLPLTVIIYRKETLLAFLVNESLMVAIESDYLVLNIIIYFFKPHILKFNDTSKFIQTGDGYAYYSRYPGFCMLAVKN